MSALPLLVRPEEKQMELADFLARRLSLSKKKAKSLCDAHIVFINGRRVWMARHRLNPRDQVEIQEEARQSVADKLDILYEDDDYLILNKPSGIVSEGQHSFELLARARLNLPTLRAVHRLDRDTSGCLLLAKRDAGFEAMIPVFRSHQVTKLYHAIAQGKVPMHLREINSPIEGQSAVTKLTLLDANKRASYLKLLLETGRTHQIRIHLKQVEHPLVGDKTYAMKGELPDIYRNAPRQMLHAIRLMFRSPITGATVKGEAPLPSDFRSWLKRLGLK